MRRIHFGGPDPAARRAPLSCAIADIEFVGGAFARFRIVGDETSILRIEFPGSDRVLDARPVSRGPVADAARELAGWSRGAGGGSDVVVRYPEATEFERAVWSAIADIPFGSTVTYGAVAAAIGRPGSARAVGAACGRNPVPLLVPCHRVVGADGPGGYAGGVELKRRLLASEVRSEKAEQPADPS